MMLVAYGDNTIQRFIINHAAILRIQIHAIGTVREGLNTVGQYIFFRVIHFINEAIAQPTDAYLSDITHVKVGMQGRGGFKFAVCFKIDFTGFTHAEMR